MKSDLSQLIEMIKQVLSFKLFELNQTPVTVASILMLFLFLCGSYIFSRILTRGILTRVFDRMKIEHGMRFTLLRLSHYTIIVSGALFSFQFVGIDMSGLTMIFGLLSVGIGFGLQNITANFISGLIILFERPIQVGDRVQIGDAEGDVLDISMRSTRIRSLNNVTMIIPNSDFITKEVVNWSHGDPRVCLYIEVGVSYSSDIDQVFKALLEVAGENPEVLKNPAPDILLLGFGDSSWNLRLRAWIPRPEGHHKIRSDLNVAIVHKFRQYNVEIPFPQRDLHIRDAKPINVVTS